MTKLKAKSTPLQPDAARSVPLRLGLPYYDVRTHPGVNAALIVVDAGFFVLGFGALAGENQTVGE